MEAHGTLEVLGVGQLHRRAKNALAREMRGQVWVKGEIKSLRASRGSLFMTLVEPGEGVDGGDASVDVAVWPKRNAIMEAQLRSAGVGLAAGVEVRVCGMVTLSKIGRLAIEMHSLDVEALAGRQMLERRQLLQTLADEAVIGVNRGLAVPLVPRRIALVTSEGSEGCNDFLGQLERSKYSFVVTLLHTSVQGPAAPRSIARAIAMAGEAKADVIAVVRGGGGELEAFDKEPVARAIVGSASPVWTGIGHTGDRSVADEVAHRSYITPTECGAALVLAVESYDSLVAEAIASIRAHARSDIRQAELRLHAGRARLASSAERRLRSEEANLAHGARALLTATTSHRQRASALKQKLCLDVSVSVQRELARKATEAKYSSNHVRALDPKRPLRRGFSLTHSVDGELVTDIEQLAEGEVIVTELGRGKVRSRVAGLHQIDEEGKR